jgi:putative PIN family toxin of toxin-antitoxin system
LIKAVLDTNVVISAIVFGGKPRRVLNLAIEGKISLFFSEPMFEEIREILGSCKFRFTEPQLLAVEHELEAISDTVYPDKNIKVVKDDPDDDVLIECVLAADADYIVSGDKHLLDLKSYGNIKIVNAAEFIELVCRR